MTTPETWVLCGNVKHRRAPPDALRLKLGENIELDLFAIDRELTGRISSPFADLIRIAAYVLAADSATRRGSADTLDMGRSWRRNFHFVIGVKHPEFWRHEEARQLLVDTVEFIADETYTFEFVREDKVKHAGRAEQLTFAGPAGEPFLKQDVDEVVLFSGGLDSFAGATDQILTHRRRVLLVSHKSATKMWQRQRDLAQELGNWAQAAGGKAPSHVAVCMHKHANELRVERTQRTRVLLFSAIAGAAAHLIQRDRVLMYENGVIAVHLPIAEQLVGARATRTAHPKTLALMSRLLTLVAGRPLKMENPFVFKTRTETLNDLRETVAKALVAQTVSCGYVHQQSAAHTHCGSCSQCIDRRVAVLAARMEPHDPETNYALKLATDSWDEELGRAMLLNYTGAAFRWARLSSAGEFSEQAGEIAPAVDGLATTSTSRETIIQQLFELHRRHGKSVQRVVGDITSRHIDAIYGGTLPKNSLPMLMIEHGRQAQEKQQPAPELPQEPDYQFRLHEGLWRLRFRGNEPFTLPPMPGLHHMAVLMREAGAVLLPEQLLALLAGEPTPIRNDVLLEGVDAKTLAEMRTRVADARRGLREAEDVCDAEGQQTWRAELETLGGVVHQMSALKRRKRAPTGEQVHAMRRVRAELDEALGAIRQQCRPLAAHLDANLAAGFVCWYRPNHLPWVLNQSQPQERAPARTSNIVLRIDLRAWSVSYRGASVPTSGKNPLQRASLLALAALAQRAGEVLPMVDLSDAVEEVTPQSLAQKATHATEGTTPEARQLRYKIIGPFRRAVPKSLAAEVDGLVTTVPHLGLRLNLRPEQIELVLSEPTGRPSRVEAAWAFRRHPPEQRAGSDDT